MTFKTEHNQTNTNFGWSMGGKGIGYYLLYVQTASSYNGVLCQRDTI